MLILSSSPGWSGDTSGCVPAPNAPPAPTVVAGTAKVTATVTSGTSGGIPSAYTVTAYTATGTAAGTCLVLAASRSCDVTALTAGSTYTVKATATNEAGTSGASVASSPVTVAAAPLRTVTFNANVGEKSMDVQTANAATALTANAFTRPGYAFDGWATTLNGSKTYADGASYPFTANATLYARWLEIPAVTVTFYPNGGTGTMANQTTNVETALTANTFTKTGYVFHGWATTSDGSNAYADGFKYPFTSDATLYGRWSCLPLTVDIWVRRTNSTSASVSFSASVGNANRPKWTSFTTTSVSVTHRAAADTTKGGQTATVSQSSYKGNIPVSGLNGYTQYTFTVKATNAAGCSYTSVVSTQI